MFLLKTRLFLRNSKYQRFLFFHSYQTSVIGHRSSFYFLQTSHFQTSKRLLPLVEVTRISFLCSRHFHKSYLQTSKKTFAFDHPKHPSSVIGHLYFLPLTSILPYFQTSHFHPSQLPPHSTYTTKPFKYSVSIWKILIGWSAGWER